MKLKKPFKKATDYAKSLFGVSTDTLRNFMVSFAIIEKYNRKGLLHWQRKQKCLLIEESLAISEMMLGADGFRDFLYKACQWQNFLILQEAYERHSIDVQTKAVREAKKQYASLTKSDITRIRQEARVNMEQLPIEKLDCIKEFDIFIIRATATNAEDATEANGQLLALGHYDGKTLEMAMYDDIKHNLHKD